MEAPQKYPTDTPGDQWRWGKARSCALALFCNIGSINFPCLRRLPENTCISVRRISEQRSHGTFRILQLRNCWQC